MSLKNLLFPVLFLCSFTQLGTSQTCIQVTVPPESCDDAERLSGQYVYSEGDETYYKSSDAYISYYDGNSDDDGWYFWEGDYDAYYNPAGRDEVPMTGWEGYEGCGGNSYMEGPVDITLQVVQCVSLGTCLEVTSDCLDYAGTYVQFATYDGAPYLFNANGNQIYFYRSGWFTYDLNGNELWVFETEDSNTLPLGDWDYDSESNVCANTSFSAASVACPALQQVPTLSQWALIILALILLVFGVQAMRKNIFQLT